jgi:hypothetical protein
MQLAREPDALGIRVGNWAGTATFGITVSFSLSLSLSLSLSWALRAEGLLATGRPPTLPIDRFGMPPSLLKGSVGNDYVQRKAMAC